jgi:hypothetical protein
VWVCLSGPIARMLPVGWSVPERMAAATLHTDLWTAGQRLFQSSSSNRWNAMAADLGLMDANSEAIRRCRERARQLGDARCTIQVTAPARGGGSAR